MIQVVDLSDTVNQIMYKNRLKCSQISVQKVVQRA